jgi:hypothetical protein
VFLGLKKQPKHFRVHREMGFMIAAAVGGLRFRSCDWKLQLVCVLKSKISKSKGEKGRKNQTCKQTREETSCSNTPSAITGKDVKKTLNNDIYQSLYAVCPEKLVKASK